MLSADSVIVQFIAICLWQVLGESGHDWTKNTSKQILKNAGFNSISLDPNTDH